MSWFSFYLLCNGIGYISGVVHPKEDWNKYKDIKDRDVIKDAINKIFTGAIINYIAWLCLKYSLPEFIELINLLLK